MIDILLIYPQLGVWDSVVKDIPLSLIYAAAHSVKAGYNVKILDLRLYNKNWKEEIDNKLRDKCKLVGLSVMTGNPIKTSLLISKYIKQKYPNTSIVWGGPHPTILPEQTLENPYIDYVIRDWGSKALCELTDFISGENKQKKNILGLGYKENGKIILAPNQKSFEFLDYKDLPYHLVDIAGDKYNRMNSGEVIFPIFTSLGCPYRCSFCMSPAVYKKFKGKKWHAFDPDSYVLEHIKYLSKKYIFSKIQIYDDDCFVDISRMKHLLKGYIEKGFHKKYKIDFRGARINELDKMDDDFLSLLVEAGTDLMFIGMESGSPNVLKIMKKDITVEQIIRVNRKLAKYPSLKVHYNFFCGVPGETIDDLILTKNLLIQLVKDHPYCLLGRGGHWKPVPGSYLAEVAQDKYELKLPNSLEGWINIDSKDADEPNYPWYSKKMVGMIKLLTVSGYLLDNKVEYLSGNLRFFWRNLFKLCFLLYRPILIIRLKYNFTTFLFEREILRIIDKKLGKLLKG